MTDATPTAVDWQKLAGELAAEVQDLRLRLEAYQRTLAKERAHAAQAVAEEREWFKRVADWLDTIVRAMLPSEHVDCGIDSGCSHARDETEAFEQLDEWVTALRAGQPGPDAA